MTTRLRWWSYAAIAAAGVLLAAAPIVEANTPQPPLHVGRIWANPEYDGAEGWSGSMLEYPGAIPIDPGVNGTTGDPNPWTSSNSLKRGWIGQTQKRGTYLFNTDWTDPDATTHDYAGSYFFRSMNYGYPPEWLTGTADVNFNYLYGGGVQAYNRFDRPNIYVDGNVISFHPGSDSLTVLPDHGGVGQYPADITDPDLDAPRTIYMWWQYIQGVKYERTQYAYPLGSPHQDYILEDIELTNDGISGNGYPGAEDPPVLTDQTLNNVIWVQAWDYRNNNAGAIRNVQDNHAMYVEPYGAGGHVAAYFWDGDADGLGLDGAEPGPDFGDPPTSEVYNGHLLGNAHAMTGPIFVSQSPANYDVNLAAQPAFRLIYGERGVDFAGADYSPTNIEDQRAFVADGFYQMEIGDDAREDARTADFMVNSQGGTALLGYGPLDGAIENYETHGWDIGFNESVRIVQVMAAGGLDPETARQIGVEWNNKRDASTTPYMTQEQVDLIATGRDTVEKAMAMAYWNYMGSLPSNVDAAKLAEWGISDLVTSKPAGHEAFDVPDAPRPPANFAVYPKANGGIELRWSTEAESAGDHDTGVNDFDKYIVYRQEATRHATWEVFATIDNPGDLKVKAADGDANFEGRYLYDNSITPSVDYWYAVVAVDDGSQNWARPGKALASSPYWTWTGYLENGIVGSDPPDPTAINGTPARFALSQNAPNPFNPTTTINFEIAEQGDANLVIYGPTGQIVRTLVNGSLEQGAHSITWDGKDNMGRPVASGVYIYRLTSGDNVAQRRMVLVK